MNSEAAQRLQQLGYEFDNVAFNLRAGFFRRREVTVMDVPIFDLVGQLWEFGKHVWPVFGFLQCDDPLRVRQVFV